MITYQPELEHAPEGEQERTYESEAQVSCQEQIV